MVAEVCSLGAVFKKLFRTDETSIETESASLFIKGRHTHTHIMFKNIIWSATVDNKTGELNLASTSINCDSERSVTLALLTWSSFSENITIGTLLKSNFLKFA